MKKLMIALMALALLTPASGLLASDGKTLFKTKGCAGCHGPQGQKKIGRVNLKGITAETFAEKMTGYQNKTIKGGMSGMMSNNPGVKGSTADDIKVMGEFLAGK